LKTDSYHQRESDGYFLPKARTVPPPCSFSTRRGAPLRNALGCAWALCLEKAEGTGTGWFAVERAWCGGEGGRRAYRSDHRVRQSRPPLGASKRSGPNRRRKAPAEGCRGRGGMDCIDYKIVISGGNSRGRGVPGASWARDELQPPFPSNMRPMVVHDQL